MRQGRILEEGEGARPRARKPGQNDDSLMRRARISRGIPGTKPGLYCSVLFHNVPGTQNFIKPNKIKGLQEYFLI
jgi:hypothetical protein